MPSCHHTTPRHPTQRHPLPAQVREGWTAAILVELLFEDPLFILVALAVRRYVVESSLGPTTSVDLFTVHSGDQGQYWAITLTATAKNAADLPRGVIDACDFYRLFDK